MSSFLRSISLAGLAVLAISLASCSQEYTGVTGAEVSGKVTLNGKPFAGGTVVFTSPTDSTTAEIRTDGSYHAENVPLGPVRVAILSLTTPKTPGKEPHGPASQPFAPTRFRSVNTSGLETYVNRGENMFDIPMTTR